MPITTSEPFEETNTYTLGKEAAITVTITMQDIVKNGIPIHRSVLEKRFYSDYFNEKELKEIIEWSIAPNFPKNIPESLKRCAL